jgi:hypothetical protein
VNSNFITTIVEDKESERNPVADPAPTDTPSADTPPADKPADTPAAQPAAVDPLDELLFGDKAEEQKPVAITEDVKSFVKEKFGFDDPEQFTSEFATVKEQLNQFKDKADQFDKVFERISNMPYELSKAVEAAAKGEDYKELLTKLTTGVTLSKEAKDIDKFALVNEHFPGKFNEEEIEAIKDGDKTLEDAFGKYHDLAAMKHNDLRQAEVQRQQGYVKQQNELKEAHQKADAAAVATFKQNKVLAQISDPDIIDKFLSGKLEEQTLYNADGTKSPEYLTLVAKGLAFDKMVARVREGAKKQGGDERELELRGRLPERPNTPPSDRGQAPQKGSGEADHVKRATLAIAEALSM